MSSRADPPPLSATACYAEFVSRLQSLHRRDERIRDSGVPVDRQVHSVERHPRIGEIDKLADIDVGHIIVAGELAHDHVGHLPLLLDMGCAQLLTQCVRLRDDEHL